MSLQVETASFLETRNVEKVYEYIKDKYGYFKLYKDYDVCGTVPISIKFSDDPNKLFENENIKTIDDFNNMVNSLNDVVDIYEPYTDEIDNNLRNEYIAEGYDYANFEIYYPFEPNMFSNFEEFKDFLNKLFTGYNMWYYRPEGLYYLTKY